MSIRFPMHVNCLYLCEIATKEMGLLVQSPLSLHLVGIQPIQSRLLLGCITALPR